MLRNAARRMLGVAQRGLTTSAMRAEEAAAPAGPKEFTAAWDKFSSNNMNLPEFPSNFLKTTSQGESVAQGDLFPVNFYTPHGVLSDMKQVGREDDCGRNGGPGATNAPLRCSDGRREGM